MPDFAPTPEQQRAIAIACPTCGVAAGQPCIKKKNENGVPPERQAVHRARYMAGNSRSARQSALTTTENPK